MLITGFTVLKLGLSKTISMEPLPTEKKEDDGKEKNDKVLSAG